MWLGQGIRLTLVTLACAALGACTRPAPATGHAPDGPDGISMVRASSGLHVVVNHHPVHMTLELNGSEVGVSEDDPHVWLVDGQIIQVAVVPRQAIYGGGGSRVSNSQLLLDHLAWESDYVSSELGRHVRVQPRECRTARGAECLVSDYALEAARHNLLVTTVVNDQVVALASLVPTTRDSAEDEARLRAVLESITPRDAWIDPAVEAARVQPGL